MKPSYEGSRTRANYQLGVTPSQFGLSRHAWLKRIYVQKTTTVREATSYDAEALTGHLMSRQITDNVYPTACSGNGLPFAYSQYDDAVEFVPCPGSLHTKETAKYEVQFDEAFPRVVRRQQVQLAGRVIKETMNYVKSELNYATKTTTVVARFNRRLDTALKQVSVYETDLKTKIFHSMTSNSGFLHNDPSIGNAPSDVVTKLEQLASRPETILANPFLVNFGLYATFLEYPDVLADY